MAKLVKCPKCHTQIDVTNVPAGSTVRCGDCDSLVRIPSGNTAVVPKVAAAATAPAPASKGDTALRRRQRRGDTEMRGRDERGGRFAKKKSGSGLAIGLAVGAVVVIGAVILVVMSNKNKQDPTPPAAASSKKPAGATIDPMMGAGAAAGAVPPVAAVVPAAPKAENADGADWDTIMRKLRSGGGFDDPEREGKTFARVKEMGKSAYPHLVKYIDNTEVQLGRAAVSILNALTNRTEPLPTEATKTKVKADWEAWLQKSP